MKAVIIKRFGSPDVLEYDYEYPNPKIYKNQVLIKVDAAGVNPLDIRIRNGSLRFITGSRFPLILGNEVSGVIIQCGDEVRNFKPGDKVYCMVDTNKRFSLSGFAKSGAYAEYCVTREDTLSIRPSTIASEEAAAMPLCCLTAYQALVKKAKIKTGDKVLINGASGGVGVYAIQIAKAFGAEISAVCSSANIDLVRSLGADFVIDYKETDITQLSDRYDIIYDVAAVVTYRQCKNILKKKGIFISNIAKPMNILTTYLFPLLRIFGNERQSTYVWVRPCGKDLSRITQMIDERMISPVIDKVFSIDKIQDAHRYFESGRHNGKIIIKM